MSENYEASAVKQVHFMFYFSYTHTHTLSLPLREE